MPSVKQKKCANESCEKLFTPYRTIDKYCCYSCSQANAKPKVFKPIVKREYNFEDEIEKSEFEKEFSEAKEKLREKIEREKGRLSCEKCDTESSIRFSVHHIIYRSEKPKHPQLNNLLNLIFLCFECHNWFHAVKSRRSYLVKERNLFSLFGEISRYEEEGNQENNGIICK